MTGRSRASAARASRLQAGLEAQQTYEAAGVSIERAEAVVERLRAAVESTGARGFGTFAGLYPLDERRLLAASTDSVGTKLILARQRGRLRDCGADIAAHCINDVLTTGADPLFFLDYVAANRIDPEQVAELQLSADEPEEKALALAEILGLEPADATVEIGETRVRFVPGGPQGRPQLDVELFL